MKRKNAPGKNKVIALFLGIFLLILILSLFKIWLTGRLASMDLEYPVVVEQIAAYKKENREMSNEILTKESLTNIDQQARLNGFSDKIEYIYETKGKLQSEKFFQL